MKSIYLDYASITPLDKRVKNEMDRWSREPLNPSSIHSLGVKAKKVLDEAHRGVADFLHAHPDEIVFTSGGTEANGLVLEGTGRAAYRSGLAKRGKSEKIHLIISAIEHSSIMETANMLERHGVEVTRLSVNKNGLVSLDELKKAIRPNTYLISIMTANNETGVIQPIREIAKIVRDARKKFFTEAVAACDNYPLFHTDACQAALYEDLNVEKLGVDFLTLDGSKIYGPRGIGCLYVKRNAAIEPIVYGGGQERDLRSGTENIPAIKGFVTALEIAKKNISSENRRVAELRDLFERGISQIRKDVIINSSGAPRVSHISNITIPGVDAEMLLLRLDAKGILCSTKSACLRDEDESYVLRAIGADSKSSLRFSFGRLTTTRDVKIALGYLKTLIGAK
ncbi:MAG: cysteine desulfurase [Patescibacteria group bacterium]|nr:cysteine desulfurase [Patescibacteria group bacterium]